ncbi:Cactin [Durusdinium trenchii]|uniref:Cactin n=1 Tax=Durusdinium trenchii TaxID=1381693 RepID=A0ABP0PYE8_9DINO
MSMKPFVCFEGWGTEVEVLLGALGGTWAGGRFGDSTLTQKFTWKKKNEYLQAAGLEPGLVKKRRDEREVERQLLEQQRLEHDKELHDEEYGEWLTKEEKFHLDNAKARTQLRIEQGRERPLDLVAKALMIAEGEQFEEMTILDKPPHQLFVNMSIEEVEDIMDEVNTFVRIDAQHRDFWQVGIAPDSRSD